MLSAVVLLLVTQTGKPLIDLPIEVSGGRIYLPVSVNGKSTQFVLDTGMDGCVVDLDWARNLGLKVGEAGSVSGVGTKQSRIAPVEGASVHVLGSTRGFKIGVAVDLASLENYWDRRVIGILGLPFFQSGVVQIDYDAQRVRLFAPGSFKPGNGAIILDHAVENGRVIVNVELGLSSGRKVLAHALVDSGALGTLLITTPLGARTGLAKSQPQYSLHRVANGVGGGSPGISCRVESIRIGTRTFRYPTIRVSTAQSGMLSTVNDWDALIGYELLRRFRITIDMAHSRVILEPGRELNAAFPVDCCGILTRREGRRYFVEEVISGSPANRAGILTGDEIVEIDGKSAAALRYGAFVARVSGPATPVKLNLGRSGKRLVKLVNRRPLL